MKELVVILSCTWKFAATFPVAVLVFNMSFIETIIYTNTGAIVGIIGFGYLSKGLIRIYKVLSSRYSWLKAKPSRPVTKSKRRMVTIKSKFGLAGIVLLTPVILSIPVGVFLCTRYYSRFKLRNLYLILSHLAWSVIYTLFYMSADMVV